MPERLIGGKRLAAAGGLLAAVALALSLAALFLWSGGGTSPGAVPRLRLEATYTARLECAGGCARWDGAARLDVRVPGRNAGLARGVAAALSTAGWRDDGEMDAQGDTISSFTRAVGVPARSPSAGLWPVSVVHRIPLPAELGGRPLPVALTGEDVRPWMPPDIRAKLKGAGEPVPVYLEPSKDSHLVLRYPRLAVEASTPASSAQAISAGRDERSVDVSDPLSYDEGAVTLDVLAKRLRAAGVADALALRHTGWVWTLVIIPIAAVAFGVVRRRADDAADRLLGSVLSRRARRRARRRT